MKDHHKLSDTELVARCLDKDAEAWETLIRRYQRLIISVALKSGLSQDDALDVFQSICLILIQKLQTLKSQDKLSSWLIVVTKHESWKVKQRGGKTDLLDEEEWERVAEMDDPTRSKPDDQVLAIQQQHLIRRAEEFLSPQCRKLLALLFSESDSTSYAEIGQEMGIPVASIGPTRGRCLSKLKEILQQLGFK